MTNIVIMKQLVIRHKIKVKLLIRPKVLIKALASTSFIRALKTFMELKYIIKVKMMKYFHFLEIKEYSIMVKCFLEIA